MTGGTVVMLAFLALALALPAMALRDRRIDFKSGWKMATIWVALFVLVAMAFRWAGL